MFEPEAIVGDRSVSMRNRLRAAARARSVQSARTTIIRDATGVVASARFVSRYEGQRVDHLACRSPVGRERLAVRRRRSGERRPGSRRVASRSVGGGSSGDPDEPEPAQGRQLVDLLGAAPSDRPSAREHLGLRRALRFAEDAVHVAVVEVRLPADFSQTDPWVLDGAPDRAIACIQSDAQGIFGPNYDVCVAPHAREQVGWAIGSVAHGQQPTTTSCGIPG